MHNITDFEPNIYKNEIVQDIYFECTTSLFLFQIPNSPQLPYYSLHKDAKLIMNFLVWVSVCISTPYIVLFLYLLSLTTHCLHKAHFSIHIQEATSFTLQPCTHHLIF